MTQNKLTIELQENLTSYKLLALKNLKFHAKNSLLLQTLFNIKKLGKN